MNPLFLRRLPPAVPQTAPGGSVRASRAASARPASGHMRGTLRRRAGRAYEPPLHVIAAAGRAPGGSVRGFHGLPALAPHAAACEARCGGGQAGLMNPLSLPPMPPAEPKPAPGGSVRASRAASARPHAAACEAGCGGGQAGLMNPLLLPPLPPAEPKPAPGCSVRASRADSARPTCGRMRGRLRRRASSAYEPPPSFTAAAGRAAAGACRQREGFTGCQRSPGKRPHARQAAEEGRQGL